MVFPLDGTSTRARANGFPTSFKSSWPTTLAQTTAGLPVGGEVGSDRRPPLLETHGRFRRRNLQRSCVIGRGRCPRQNPTVWPHDFLEADFDGVPFAGDFVRLRLLLAFLSVDGLPVNQ